MLKKFFIFTGILFVVGIAACLWMYYGYKYSNPYNYKTIGEISTPWGYERVEGGEGSFADYLRSLSLKKRGSQVQLFTGGKAHLQSLNYAVVDMPLLSNAEQCADVCMRLRAEYLYSNGNYGDIHFQDVNGNVMRYQGGELRKSFESFMRKVYGMASTYSLTKEMPRRKLEDMMPGDVFVYAAVDRPGHKMGHAVMVVDVAVDDDGKKVFMLAEGNTPAREIHVLSNWLNPIRSPWFTLDETADVIMLSPFIYKSDELRRWK